MSKLRTGRQKVLGTIGMLVVLGLLYWAREKGWLEGGEKGTKPVAEGPRNSAPFEWPAETNGTEAKGSETRGADPQGSGSKSTTKEVPKPEAKSASAADADAVEKLFLEKRSEVWVEGAGEVVKVLADDNEGSRHQKWLMKVGTVTVLVAHNIDVAARVPLKAGERVGFRGEYIWTEKGGTLHWTHRDKSSQRKGGWIEHRGEKIQ